MVGTTGGNWKEMWLAASQPGGGDLDLVKFHLRNGVDPNYQHPEMESTALCEAVSAGNERVVEYLLKYHLDERGREREGVRAVDPTIPSAYENQTPLEIAMEMQSHVMVDMILEALPPDRHAEGSRYCRRILVTMPDNIMDGKMQYAAAVLMQVLRLGHRTIALAPADSDTGHDDDDDPSILRAHFAKHSGNVKFWSVPSAEDVPPFLRSSSDGGPGIRPTKIDTWLCFLPGGVEREDDSLLDLVKSEFVRQSSILSNDEDASPSQVLLMIPSTCLATQLAKQQLIWFLRRCHSQTTTKGRTVKVMAMIIPCSWWDSLWRGGSPYWIEAEVLGRLLEKDKDDGTAIEAGGIYNHKLEQMPWAEAVPDPDTATATQWDKELLSQCRIQK